MQSPAASSRFTRITLVSVTGLPDAQSAANALALSLHNMPGAQALLCSPIAPDNLHPQVRHYPIAPLSYFEYSFFVMLALWQLIETDFALIVQDDGWVLDGGNWLDEYFEYDYIGGIVGSAWVHTPEGLRCMGGFSWCDYLNRSDYVVDYVLNGGFSLRSRRMLRAFVDYPEIKIQVGPPDFLDGDLPRMRWIGNPLNDDVQLSTVLRPKLEALGMRFAPLPVCRQFSVEAAGKIHEGFDFMTLFGHHAPWRRLMSIDPPTVRYRVTEATLGKHPYEIAFVGMLQRRGYVIECRLPDTTDIT